MGEYSRVYKTDLTDRQLMQFWGLAQAEGRSRAVSYCLPPQDGEGFCRWMRQDGVHPWLILFREQPCGLFFLTDMQGKAAQCHFCTLPMGTQRTEGRLPVARGAGLFALGAALWEETETSYRLDTLIGVTPVCNKHAVKYVQSLGGRACGVVPGMCWYYETNENVPGLVTVFDRTTVPESAAGI